MPQTPTTLSKCATEYRCALSAAWGCPVSIWLHNHDHWRPLTNAGVKSSAALVGLLNQARQDQGFACRSIDDDLALIAFNLNAPDVASLVALGELPGSTHKLTEIIARITQTSMGLQRELDRQSSQLTAYAAQVTHDLEELTWLRSLSEKIELSDDRNSVRDACEEIIPAFQEMVLAEQVLLLPVDETTKRAGHVVYSSGLAACSSDVAQEIVRQFADVTQFQPAVRNRIQESANKLPGVNSFMLVAVATNSYHYGWLLIVNRIRPNILPGADYDPYADIDHYNAEEFGTLQASLATAAAAAMATYASNSKLLSDRDRLLTGAIRSMVNAIDARDSYTSGHSDRVALMSKHLARKLNLPPIECQQIYMTGLLHDIGKIGVPDSILLKPGRLTEEEFAVIQTHPAVGYDILKHVELLQYTLPGVLHHHEAVDGSGYPAGLRGDAIPVHARILAVADAYDAMTSNRPYRDGMPRERAESILNENSGVQWDAQVVDTFMQSLPTIHRICFGANRFEHKRSQLIERFAQSSS